MTFLNVIIIKSVFDKDKFKINQFKIKTTTTIIYS